ncbi:hypothetical protein RHGRI_001639 [Rhododendron griersonianum]|uniref:DUF4283 domain-containing protein n=1 Tax=Rhododendron griersonianum TaxID=479676 RepID=A0AAV6LNW5_9ERIC|nr:hypothetical protein RHGRI_001639 [Rhododendron griersonianum]
MADGTLSMADGLGLKAIDSHELHRRHHTLGPEENPQIRPPQMSNPNSPILFELDSNIPVSNELHPRLHSQGTVPTSSSISTSNGFGAQSPKSAKNHSLSQKSQQPFNQPSPALNQVSPKEGMCLDSEARMLEIVGHLEDELNISEDPFVLDVLTAKLQSIQQLWKKSEAEERLQHEQDHLRQVQPPIPTPRTLINTRGTPYLEGDPNMGYPEADTKPRRPFSPKSQFNQNYSTHSTHTLPQQPPIKPRPNSNGPKPKPKNWASLLQSQSPSLDMKLEFYPDLFRGKEAQVEIDIELTDVGMWNKYLMGHFLDGKMAYPLIVSTTRYQWKELFVAVKPDVGGCYLFEFRDEQAKQEVLDGGPYFFSQKYLVLKDWHRMMKPVKEQPSHIPAWVKLHDLPLELWNQECLSRVASTIGKPLHVDQATAKTSRQPGLLQTKSTSARICIEINAQHELPADVEITVEGESVVVPIEYQVLPLMCKLCQVFGHSTAQCSKKPPPPTSQTNQDWILVGNGNLRNHSTSSTLSKLTADGPHAEVLTHSESELEEMLEKVVSTSQITLNQPQSGSPPHCPSTNPPSLSIPTEQQEAPQQTTTGHNSSEEQISNSHVSKVAKLKDPSMADPISRSAAKKAAKVAAKLKDQEPPDPGVPDIKLLRGGSFKAGFRGKQKSWTSSHRSGK